MKIGTQLILHKNAHPDMENLYKEDDKIVSVIITETKPVPCMWTGSMDGSHLGLRACAKDGRVFTNNWENFATDSVTPRWMWNKVMKKNESIDEYDWYDITYVRPPFRPVFLDDINFKDILSYCEQHNRLDYTENGGCYMCEYGIPPLVKPDAWKGWR